MTRAAGSSLSDEAGPSPRAEVIMDEPCTAPTLSSSAAKPACGCSHATEAQPVRVFTEHRSFSMYAPVGISPVLAEEDFPSGLVVVLAGAAALAWTRQRLGPRLVQLHLARPEPVRERRRFRLPRVVLSEGERRRLAALRAFFARAPMPAPVPLRAVLSRKSAGR
jgi:hypothetical protein